MQAVDSNILIYARRRETPQHTVAADLLHRLATGLDPWVLPWPCIYEFLRVVTHPKVFRPPTSLERAWEGILDLLASPSVRLVTEGTGHAAALGKLLHVSGATGNLIFDAHIAALLIEHGVDEIITADEDFRRFPELKVTNPFRP